MMKQVASCLGLSVLNHRMLAWPIRIHCDNTLSLLHLFLQKLSALLGGE